MEGRITPRRGLWQASDTRNLIGQAQGMLRQKYGITADKAFSVLRRYSQHHNLKPAAAEQLTTTGAMPDWPEDPGDHDSSQDREQQGCKDNQNNALGPHPGHRPKPGVELPRVLTASLNAWAADGFGPQSVRRVRATGKIWCPSSRPGSRW